MTVYTFFFKLDVQVEIENKANFELPGLPCLPISMTT